MARRKKPFGAGRRKSSKRHAPPRRRPAAKKAATRKARKKSPRRSVPSKSRKAAVRRIADALAERAPGPVVAAILAFVDSIVPGRVESVWLTGSRARGNARADSDWDVVAFTAAASQAASDLFKTSQIGPDVGGGPIQLVVAHPSHWDDPRPFMAECRRAGIRLR